MAVKNPPQAKQVLLSMAPVVPLRRAIDAQTIFQSIAALKHIHNKGYQRTVVLSNSLSALQTLQTYQTSRPNLLNTILTLLHKSTQCNQHIQFQWIPSLVGIQGNETVDNTAKQALSHNNLIYNIPLGVTEIYSIIHCNILDMYKTQLNTNTKLMSKIKPNPSAKPLNYHSNIHYDKIITRLSGENQSTG
jgi:hypothetical protein